MENSKYDYGKWVESNVINLIRRLPGYGDLTQILDEYSRIDAVLLRNSKLVPIQIKAISPRIFYKDISIKKSQFDAYKKIVELNGDYICFLVTSIYNKERGLDYSVFKFNFKDIPYSSGRLSKWDATPTVYLKLSDMEKLNILPITFQQEMEKLHIEFMRPSIDSNYIDLYQNKFEH